MGEEWRMNNGGVGAGGGAAGDDGRHRDCGGGETGRDEGRSAGGHDAIDNHGARAAIPPMAPIPQWHRNHHGAQTATVPLATMPSTRLGGGRERCCDAPSGPPMRPDR